MMHWCSAMPRITFMMLALPAVYIVHGELEGITLKARENVMIAVGQMLAPGAATVTGCDMEPSRFDPKETFYLVKCERSVISATLTPLGTSVYTEDARVNESNPLVVEVPMAKRPTLKIMYSCPHKMSSGNRKGCTAYRFDVSRLGSDTAQLLSLGFNADEIVNSAIMKPTFNAAQKSYEVSISMGEKFTISASNEEGLGTVGIEFAGDKTINSGLGVFDGCELSSLRTMTWRVTGLKAIGEYKYRICAFAPDGLNIVNYYLVVKTTPSYSAHLSNLKPGLGYSLIPPFDPSHHVYHVIITPGVLHVPLFAATEDPEAALDIGIPGSSGIDWSDKNDADLRRGNATTVVKMIDNSHLKYGETPQWTSTVNIQVTSADGESVLTYMVTMKTNVSSYSYLKNIEVGDDTDCTLDPPFQQNITEYNCIWWWENDNGDEEDVGKIRPVFDKNVCIECQILAPDHSDQPKLRLSYHSQGADRVDYKSGEEWFRKFLYGETHRVPFQVVSADKYTSLTYWVTLKRDCPMWMQTWFTRMVSHTATGTAFVMAISSIPNLRSLAQQVQFMTLTTDIEGVPKIYKDFASSMKSVNLDVFSQIPWEKFGIPTTATIAAKKEEWMHALQKKMGIPSKAHGKLLLQYCWAMKVQKDAGQKPDLLMPNAVLEQAPAESFELIKEVEQRLGEEAKMESDVENEFRSAEGHVERKVEDALGLKKEQKRRLSLLPSSTVTDEQDWSAHQQRTSVSLRGAGDSFQDDDVWGPEDSIWTEFEEEFGTGSHPRRLGGALSLEIILRPKEFKGLLKDALAKDGMTKDVLRKKFAVIPCDAHEEIDVVLGLLFNIQQLHAMRKMLMSTVGTFVMLAFIFTVLGSTYAVFYFFFLRGRQARVKVLEPGPLWIFLLDYTLIAFAKASSKVVFRPTQMQILSWRPPIDTVKTICLLGLIAYPCCFVGYIWRQVRRLTNSHLLVWNPEFEKWSDPRCRCIKVAYYPTLWFPLDRIPGLKQIIQRIFTVQLHDCIPVLDAEGEMIDFASTQSLAEKKKEERLYHGNPVVLEKYWDKEIRADLEKLQVPGANKDKLNRAKVLEEDLRQWEAQKKQKEGQATILKERQVNMQQLEQDNAQKDETKDINARLPPWLSKEFCGEDKDEVYKAQSMCNLVETFVSKKSRGDQERLDQEESFAMGQWIEQAIRSEKKLLKYNIISCGVLDGYLKPLEPMNTTETMTTLKKATEKPWLNNENAYLVPETEWGAQTTDGEGNTAIIDANDNFGHIDAVQDYGKMVDGVETTYIENARGQRLVYMGNDGRFMEGSRNWLTCIGGHIPGGYYGGKCLWLDEPDDGWDVWYQKTRKPGQPEPGYPDNKKGTPSLRYADKWQWLMLNESTEPWNDDDATEGVINICGREIKRSNVFFWQAFRKWMLSRWCWRVPFRVLGKEKVEMRKWLWVQLLSQMKLKIKLAYMADKHPKFYKERSLVTIAETTFDEVWKNIEKGSPIPTKLVGRERFADMRNELMAHTLMRVEDTVDFADPEPWNNAVDPAQAMQKKVQFDTHNFWRTIGDPGLDQLRAESSFVPKYGFSSCTAFTKHAETSIAVKRFTVIKPDGSRSKVKVNVQMKHVLPLMRYTTGFKLNVMQDDLDMQYRDHYSLIVGNKKYGEQYNYIVERMTTIISIVLLAARPSGKICALVFCLTKSVSWSNSIKLSFGFKKYKDQQEHTKQAANDEYARAQKSLSNDAEPAGPSTSGQARNASRQMTEEQPLVTGGQSTKIDHGWRSEYVRDKMKQSFVETDVLKEFLQALVLLLLCFGEFWILPKPLCAIFCILVCSYTMIMMNMATFSKEIQKFFDILQAGVTKMHMFYNQAQYATKDFLNGNNVFGYQFYEFKKNQKNFQLADKVSMIVPDLGITFEGVPDLPDGLSPEELHSLSIGKRVVDFVMDADQAESRMRSAREHWRWEEDICPSLIIAIDMEQMLYRKKLPQVVATIQCLNHIDSSDITRPQFDSYLTLVKELPGGDDWEDEHDEQEDKTEALLECWNEQIKIWFFETLGATVSEKTATAAIQKDLHHLLKEEVVGSTERNMHRLDISNLEIPETGSWIGGSLEGRLGYLRVLYDDEKITEDFPMSRVTRFGMFKKEEIEEDNASKARTVYKLKWPKELDVDEGDGTVKLGMEMNLEVPVGVTYVKFTIWAQTIEEGKEGEQQKGAEIIGHEELVGFTHEIDLGDINNFAFPEQYPDLEGDLIYPFTVYSKWFKKGSQIEPEEDFALTKDEQREAEYQRRRRNCSTVDHEEAQLSHNKRVEHRKQNAKVQSCWQRCKTRSMDMFKYLYKCLFQPTEEEAEKTRGKILVRARKFNAEEHKEDMEAVVALKELIGGGAVDLPKIKRHKDRWLLFSSMFGIKPSLADIQDIEKHLESMRTVADEIDKLEAPDILDFYATIKSQAGSVTDSMKVLLGVRQHSAKGGSTKANNKSERHAKRRQQDRKKQLRESETLLKSKQESPEYKETQKKKKAKLFENDMRNTLSVGRQMRDSVERLEKEILDAKGQLKIYEKIKFRPVRVQNLTKRLIGANHVVDANRISSMRSRKKGCCGGLFDFAPKQETHTGSVFPIELLAKLQRDQEDRMASSKQLLHYVIMSEHLKASKQWRPDTIVPHVAIIMSGRSPVEGDRVKLMYGTEDDPQYIWFDKETTMIQGKVAYETTRDVKIARDGTILWHDIRDPEDTNVEPEADRSRWVKLCLYWDGNRRWTISPEKGARAPYGLHTQNVKGIMWVQDNAVSPEDIKPEKKWQVWKPERYNNNYNSNSSNNDDSFGQSSSSWKVEVGCWEADESIWIASGGGELRKAQSAHAIEKGRKVVQAKHFTDKPEEQRDEAPNRFQELWRELTSFLQADAQTVEENRDCLVSLTSENIQFSWKDEDVESLAPFRRFLLTEFGSYNHAWLYMTRHLSIETALAAKNLSKIFSVSFKGIQSELEKDDEIDSEVEDEMVMTRENTARLDREKSERRVSERLTSERPDFGSQSTDRPVPSISAISQEVGPSTSMVSGTGSESPAAKKMKKKRTLQRGALPGKAPRKKKVGSLEKKAHSAVSTLGSKASSLLSAAANVLPAAFAAESGGPQQDCDPEVDVNELQELMILLRANMSFSSGDESELIQEGHEFDELARRIVATIDADRGGQISFEELRELYNSEPVDGTNSVHSDPLIKDLKKWLNMHPWYAGRIDVLWSELTADMGINMEEFSKSMRNVFLKFTTKDTSVAFQGVSRSTDCDTDKVAVLSANWAPAQDEDFASGADMNKERDLFVRFEISGDGAIDEETFTNPESWNIMVEGREERFHPVEALGCRDKAGCEGNREGRGCVITQVPVPFEDNVIQTIQKITMKYSKLPFGRVMYFRYGKSGDVGTAYEDASVYSEVEFKAQCPGQPEDEGEKIFALLDADNNSRITSKELVPESGDRMEDVDQSMVKFSLPLALVQSLSHAKSPQGREDMKAIKLKVKPSFALSDEWKHLRISLNQDWICLDQDEEEIKFCMLPEFYKLWKTVIKECKLEESQAWVRFYDGGYLEHPTMSQVFMRHGKGVQRWASGQIYDGTWENHLYHGQGRLFACLEDYMQETKAPGTVKPKYDGSWRAGMRDGIGQLNWEQERDNWKEGRRRESHLGFRKIYTGEFKDGFFHGKGKLRMRDATAHNLPASNPYAALQTALRRVPVPNISSVQMLQFDGIFHSDWNQVWQEMKTKKLAPQFVMAYENDFEPLLDEAGKPVLYEELDSKGEPIKKDVVTIAERNASRDANGVPLDSQGKSMPVKLNPVLSLDQLLEEGAHEDKKKPASRQKRYLGFVPDGEGKMGVPSGEIQKAAIPAPDLALAYYSLKLDNVPAECFHIRHGWAKYADGTHYKGPFELGRPHVKGYDLALVDLEKNGELHHRHDQSGKYGHLIQFEDKTDIKLAEYEGEFHNGERTGMGTYTYWSPTTEAARAITDASQHVSLSELSKRVPGLTYQGPFNDGRRHSEQTTMDAAGNPVTVMLPGTQTIHPAAMQSAFGYCEYKGMWKDDFRHGEGVLTSRFLFKETYADQENKVTEELIYTGQFVNGKRHGNGSLVRKEKREEGAHVIYNGLWKDDRTFADSENPAWSQVGEQIYHGEFENDERQGKGVLYEAEALQDADFKRAFEAVTAEARRYIAPASWTWVPIVSRRSGQPDATLKTYKVYEGDWANNLSHGKGVQYFDLGVYQGQFEGGQRHGRGSWESSGKNGALKWWYWPSPSADRPEGAPPLDAKNWSYNEGPGNWLNDMMHGLAIVEDGQHVHVNVIYTRGQSQMPWTDNGPPSMGIDLTAVKALLGHQGNKIHQLETIDVVNTGHLLGGRPQANPDNIDASNGKTLGVLIRQPTDFEAPEEDLLISGGEFDNQVMNGMYFKMYGTFGLPIYKLAKQMPTTTSNFLSMIGIGAGNVGKKAIARYFYQHSSREYWVIADSPDRQGSEKMVNWAYVKSSAGHPGEIPQDAEWYVWHEQSRSTRSVKDNLLADPKASMNCAQSSTNGTASCYAGPMKPVDNMKVSIVVGYEVTGLLISSGTPIACFMLRHPSQFYGRPVYESDSVVEQYLFWMEDKGNVEDGLLGSEAEHAPGRVVKSEEKLFAKKGYWVIAKEMLMEGTVLDWETETAKKAGLPFDQLSAIAWIADTAVTPDHISKDAIWQIRQTNRTGSGADTFTPTPTMKVRAEEWKPNKKAEPEPNPIDSNPAALALPADSAPKNIGFIPILDDDPDDDDNNPTQGYDGYEPLALMDSSQV